MAKISCGLKLWPFSLYFEQFLVKKEVSRGSTSHVSSELIFMFLESVEHVEWGQLAS